jgi:hypothetical protein
VYLESTFISVNIPPKKEERSYTYYLEHEGSYILCTFIGVRSLPLLCPHDLHIFRLRIKYCLVLYYHE